MGSSLNFLIGADFAGVLEDEEDVDADAPGCLVLWTSIMSMPYDCKWPKPIKCSSARL